MTALSLLVLLSLGIPWTVEPVGFDEPSMPGEHGGTVQALEAFLPDTVIRPPGGPELAFFNVGSSEVVSIRVSVPLVEAVEEAGAAQILRIQARDRMQTLANRIGARAQVHRTGQALVYHVSGAVEDLDFLGWILRAGLAEPEADRFEAARREARIDLQQRQETPEGALALRLLTALAPGAAPLQGSEGALDRLDSARVTALWSRSHLRGELRIVAAGRLDPVLLLPIVTDLGLPEDGPTAQQPPSESTGTSRGAPEVIREWIGFGWELNSEDTHAAQLVSARLLSQTLRDAPGSYEASVELWEIGRRRAVVVSGAAYPGNLPSLRQRLSGLPEEARSRVDDVRVEAAASALRTELRAAARTPWDLTELVGQGWDSQGSARAVADLLQDLERVDVDAVLSFLDYLQSASPVREELTP